MGVLSYSPLTGGWLSGSWRTELAAADVTLDEAVIDRIDEIVPPGTTINPVDNSFDNPALVPAIRRR